MQSPFRYAPAKSPAARSNHFGECYAVNSRLPRPECLPSRKQAAIMTPLERFLAYAESNRADITAAAVLLILVIAFLDWWVLPNSSIGFLYLVPILLSAAALNSRQILAMAVLCGYLREAFDPLQGIDRITGWRLVQGLSPRYWVAGSGGRLVVSIAGFAMTGFFVAELNQRRRRLRIHLEEREEQTRLRREAERQLQILTETSPLAILTLDENARVIVANDSARQLLGFSRDETIEGQAVEPYLPILARMLQSRAGHLRTNVECRGQRRNGEVFLAHVWLSTFEASHGLRLAAVVWDASENLRDREGAGVDSMMATSRVLIAAFSHEIRNLASAAASAYAACATPAMAGGAYTQADDRYHALGTLIEALEKLASSGLRASASRERAVADLGTILDETRIVIEPGLREAGVNVVWETSPDLPLVQCDQHSLLQVFVNLARNSQEALKRATRRELRISAAPENDLVVIRFCDTGPGVAHPDQLFRPFQQGSQSDSQSFGLGLYVSRAILRSYGGSIRYEPQDAGSCFAVELWPVENRIEDSRPED
jgi:two-component system, LuxR family, sensor kinase FixL